MSVNFSFATEQYANSLSWWYDNFQLGIVNLYEDGCLVDGVRNCTAMCLNQDLVWQSGAEYINLNVPSNVDNCITFEIVANVLLYGDNTSEIYAQADKAAKKFDIRKEVVLETDYRLQPVCLKEYCLAFPDACPEDSGSWYHRINIGAGEVLVPDYNILCSETQGELNPDIAGIGVVVAYLTAAAFMLTLYLALRFSRNLIKHITFPCFFVLAYKSGNGRKDAMSKASALQKSISDHSHTSILTTSLADFQKSQCIFWLAIDIAVSISVLGKSETLGANNLPDYFSNVTTLQNISVCGYLFTAFGLYCLHLVSQRSWYVFSLSFLTIVCSGLAWGMTFLADAERLQPDREDFPIIGCGPVDPRTYCPGVVLGVEWLSSDQLDSVAIGFGGFCVLGILGDLMLHSIVLKDTRMAKRLCTHDRPLSRLRKITSLTRMLVELLFVALCGILIACLRAILVYTKREWGFGQVIAITIWIPILVEYILALFRGFEKASDHRIAPPFKVVRTDHDSTVEELTHHPKVNMLADATRQLSGSSGVGVQSTKTGDPSSHTQIDNRKSVADEESQLQT